MIAVFQNTIHADLCSGSRNITSNDLSFGCPIMHMDTIHDANLFVDTSRTPNTTKTHSLIGKPFLTITVSNDG